MSALCNPWTAAGQGFLSFTISRSLFKLTSIELVMSSNHLILCHPLLLLPSIFPSIRVFSNESVLCIRWTKYWSFSFSINLSNEYSGLISFRMDWLDLLVIQGTLKSLLQGLPWWLSGKEPACQSGNLDLIPGSGRSPGEGHGNPLQYSCLGNPMDRGIWRATVYRVTKETDIT